MGGAIADNWPGFAVNVEAQREPASTRHSSPPPCHRSMAIVDDGLAGVATSGARPPGRARPAAERNREYTADSRRQPDEAEHHWTGTTPAHGRVSAVQGPVWRVVAGVDSNLRRLSRWFYRPAEKPRQPGLMRPPGATRARIRHRRPQGRVAITPETPQARSTWSGQPSLSRANTRDAARHTNRITVTEDKRTRSAGVGRQRSSS